ncbi:MAG: transcriptional regulator with XRE-family HTH domain [Halocynthiibacter sp.]|jgi:transcriptional regulator with XRE-family HTH domain
MSGTQENQTPEAQSRAALAIRLRALRKSKGLTIQDVAERSGLAISTVSKIERNLMAPTYDRFSRLARGLGVDLAELFAEEGTRFEQGGVALARRGDFGYHETDNYTYEMLFQKVQGRAMVPMLGTLKPLEKMKFDRMVSHAGEEFLFVIEGEVIVQMENMDPVTLRAGDSLYFDSRRGHLYASATDQPARILCVCTHDGSRENAGNGASGKAP